ncbi:MAG: caspase family protein, partial [Planctomycetota bacterium]
QEIVRMRSQILLLAGIGTLVASQAVRGDGRAGHAASHALLVGCTTYPHLPLKYSLRGPSNDVALARRLLVGRFGFAKSDIVSLTRDAAENLIPTRRNIEREFGRLAEIAERGDQVFVLLAGHGSQQPDDSPEEGDPEPDGLDEVFLPQDVTAWDAGVPAVGAITDDEIRRWLDAIRSKGASVFFVADTCHSGSIDRGPADEESLVASRWVDPAVLTRELADRGPANPNSGASVDADFVVSAAEPAGAPGALVSLYAVPSNQPEKEHPMPPNEGFDDPRYGRLTYALGQVISNSRSKLTYRDLARRLRWQYEHWGWSPACYLQAGDLELDRELLGDSMIADSSAPVVTRSEFGDLAIDVGALRGVTVGTVFAVRPVNEAVGVSDAHVVVTAVGASQSVVTPCGFAGAKELEPKRVPAPGKCRLVEAGPPDFTLRVRVVPRRKQDNLSESALGVRRVVEQLVEESGGGIEQCPRDALPDLFVIVGGTEVRLARSFDAGDASSGAPTFGPYSIDEVLDQSLKGAFKTVRRVLALRSLAGMPGNAPFGDVAVEIGVELWDRGARSFQAIPIGEDLVLRNRDRVRVRVANAGRTPVDVTVLYVESGFRIRSYFPTARQALTGSFDNRVAPGGRPAVVPFPINDSTTGLEDVVVIATAARPEMRQHFAFFEQGGLRNSERGRGASGHLKRLLDAAGKGQTIRGGGSPTELASYALERLSWTITDGSAE